MSELLKMEHLVKYYGNKTSLTKALNDISLTVEQGEFTAIMGASGSGKTTLLNCISTIDRPTGGKVWIDGVCTSELKKGELADFRRNRLGFIFQEFNLLDTLTAFDNIALALQIQKCPHDKIKEKIEAVAQKLGIREVLEKYPYQLSGGQKQRVAAARAIITHPSLILADEPTASCIYTQKGNKKIRKPQAADQTAFIFARLAAARLFSINSIRRLCWS